jgi:uncharacterized membrane protein YwzB
MIIVMLALMIIVITLYLASAVKYDEFIKPLDKKEYILKRFLPIGFFIPWPVQPYIVINA